MYLVCFWSLVQENVILRLLRFVITANRACWYKGMRPVKYWIDWFIYRQRYGIRHSFSQFKILPCFDSEHPSTKQMKGPAYAQHTVLTVDLPTWTIQLSKVTPSQPPMLCFHLYAALKNHIWLSTFFAASKYAGNKFSMTPYISPRLTPSATPKIISTSVSPRGYSAAGSPKRTSGAVSPTKTTIWYPSSQQSSAANSPPRNRTLPGSYKILKITNLYTLITWFLLIKCFLNSFPARTPRMDGKEFFRQARWDLLQLFLSLYH